MPTVEQDQELDDLLLMLKETRGFDFTGYKRTTLTRRIRRRMDARGLSSFAEYSDYLELEPDEFVLLFDSLLINVTGFFRDPPAWQVLGERILPELLAAKGAARPIRVWSAGCATGEEAYTLAIVLAETLDLDEFRSRVKIYATDLDEDALRKARAGVYTERQVADVPPELRAKYFETSGSTYSFRRDLRRQVIFGRNDLTQDAPISRVDLLVARNTLMYFTAETQAAVVRKFHFALANPGFLFLGKAEMLLDHGDQFEPVDLRKRLFRKVPVNVAGEVFRAAVPEPPGPGAPRIGLGAAAFTAGPVAQLVIDRMGRLAGVNLRAESLFHIHPRNVGRPFQDLEVSYRPAELRSVIEHVKADQRAIELTDIIWHHPGDSEPSVYDVTVAPLQNYSAEFIGIGITFLDVTRYRTLRDELERSNRDLERAYEDLQSLNEELETTNEELQSTNEELETTNEELQSTNEELETMNEELQSTNEELQTTNDVLRTRSDELDSANDFLNSVMRSLSTAVIVVNADLKVLVWSPGAEELWGLRTEEAAGKALLALDIGLPVQEIMPMLRQILGQDIERTSTSLDALNRRGRPVSMRITCRRLSSHEGATQGVILMLDAINEQDVSTAESEPGH